MTWKNSAQFLASSLLLTIALASGPARAKDPVKEVRLYAIECGRMEVKDMGAFADTGEYDGQSGTLAVSCYLIRHPKGTLLWDTGLSDKLAENKDGGDVGPFKLRVKTPLIDQLKTIGVTPADVTYLAFSHFHFDHTGNANAFAASTWIVNKAELAWAESTPTPFGVDPSAWSAVKTATTRLIDGDHRLARTRVVVSALAGALGRSRVYSAERVSWVGLEGLTGTDTLAYDGEVAPTSGELRLEKRERGLVVYRPAVPQNELAQQARLAAATARYRRRMRGRPVEEG